MTIERKYIIQKQIQKRNIFKILNNYNQILFNKKNINKSKEEDGIKFLKWNNNSCRYDVFFYLFTFIILKDIEKIEQFENSNIKILKNIVYQKMEFGIY